MDHTPSPVPARMHVLMSQSYLLNEIVGQGQRVACNIPQAVVHLAPGCNRTGRW